ncbi:MAG: HAD hydrolase-like protein, partial [Flavobacteriales bacterium]
MKLKGCLFDMDGVIVDSASHHYVAWKRLAEELSIPFTEEDNHALKGLSRVDSLEHILRLGHLQLDEKTKLKL